MPVKKKKKKAVKKRKAVVKKKRVVKKRPAVKKRPVVKKRVVAKKKPAGPKLPVIGTVTHYFPHVRAAVIKLKTPLSVGDTVKIKGHTTDFKQKVTSIQIDRVPINSAKKGDEIGLLVDSRVRQHDIVYKA